MHSVACASRDPRPRAVRRLLRCLARPALVCFREMLRGRWTKRRGGPVRLGHCHSAVRRAIFTPAKHRGAEFPRLCQSLGEERRVLLTVS